MTRKEFFINCFLSSVFMTMFMSGVISGTKVGYGAAFLYAWRDAFLLSWPLALIFNLTVLPQVKALSSWLANIGRTKQDTA